MNKLISNFLKCAVITISVNFAVMAETSVLSLLPTSSTVEAKVMQIGAPPEAQKLAEKIQEAFSSQPEWAKLYIENSTPGKPLLYHPNFHITESEYNSFLEMADKLVLTQVGSIKLHAEKLQNGDFQLVTEPNTSVINGIIISADEKSVKTPLSVLNEISSVNNQDKSGVTGRWTGIQWKYQNIENPLSVKLAVGNRPDFNDNIIYYDVQDMRDGKSNAYYEILLFQNAK